MKIMILTLVILTFSTEAFAQMFLILHKKDGSRQILNTRSEIDSITFSDLHCPGIPTITYEGKIYNTVLIDEQCWLRENLNVGTRIEGSQDAIKKNGVIEKYCYDNDPNNCETYGGLYQWDEAMQYTTTPGTQGICPPDWHLPTIEEFSTLKSTVGGDGNALKLFGQGDGTNISGFSALLAGNRYLNGNFFNLGITAYFWSSTEYSSTIANYMLLNPSVDIILNRNDGDNVLGLSVRCLKN